MEWPRVQAIQDALSRIALGLFYLTPRIPDALVRTEAYRSSRVMRTGRSIVGPAPERCSTSVKLSKSDTAVSQKLLVFTKKILRQSIGRLAPVPNPLSFLGVHQWLSRYEHVWPISAILKCCTFWEPDPPVGHLASAHLDLLLHMPLPCPSKDRPRAPRSRHPLPSHRRMTQRHYQTANYSIGRASNGVTCTYRRRRYTGIPSGSQRTMYVYNK